METTTQQDLSFKWVQFNQLQAVLKNYKQAQAKASVETDREALVEAIVDLEAQLRQLEVELNSLAA
jgi:flagellar hook-associated protein FlgK